MEKSLTQITFDFKAVEATPQGEPAIIARVKALKGQAAAMAGKEADIPVPAKKNPSSPIKNKKAVAGKRGRRSLKEIGTTADLIQVPADDILFKKQYYSIGEVAGMFRENQSLIRYWETEFDILQPMKNKKGDRFFRPADIKNLVLIYDLLRRRKFTIEGAKDYLKKTASSEQKFAMIQSLGKIKSFLLELKASL